MSITYYYDIQIYSSSKYAFCFRILLLFKERFQSLIKRTRTKTSIRYVKENDREKREKERKKERFREGGIDKRERERER